MPVQAATSGVYTDFQGLAKLRSDATKDPSSVLRTVASQFESLFMQMVLKSMRDASLGDSLFGGSQMDMYRDISDKQLAVSLSEKGGLGIADMMVKQLGGTLAAENTGDADKPAAPVSLDDYRRRAINVVNVVKAEQQKPNTVSAEIMKQIKAENTVAKRVDHAQAIARKPEQSQSFNSPVEFVKTVLSYAKDAAETMGFAPEILVAQAALETGWGKHIMQHNDGRSSHNLFGIKADNRWDGDRVASNTLEFRDGVMRNENASFRSYDSIKESIVDYLNFLKSNPRYQKALQASQKPGEFAEHLHKAGYATDPEYATKIKQILSSDLLKDISLKDISPKNISRDQEI